MSGVFIAVGGLLLLVAVYLVSSSILFLGRTTPFTGVVKGVDYERSIWRTVLTVLNVFLVLVGAAFPSMNTLLVQVEGMDLSGVMRVVSVRVRTDGDPSTIPVGSAMEVLFDPRHPTRGCSAKDVRMTETIGLILGGLGIIAVLSGLAFL